MAHFTQQHQKSKDPFSVQPLPKSFYFPSPKKYVDGSQAIQVTSQNAFKTGQSDWNASNNNFYTSSSGSVLRDLPFVNKADHSDEKDDTAVQFDETWPDSERPSSPSFAGNISAQTAATGFTVSEESNVDLQEAVDLLEASDRYRFHNAEHPTATDADPASEESTLLKYIERFRKSEPKSRAERMKEMQMKRQEFWWLQSDTNQNHDSTSKTRRAGEQEIFDSGKNSRNGSNQEKVKLTKEALLAMDEETLHLQTKADRLLSKSELSLASSGPIVSTEGLGTSCSLSDRSSVVDAPSYRPAFVNIKENFRETEASNFTRKGGREVQIAPTAKSNGGDVLARWRFRRKMEESQGHSQPKEETEAFCSKSSKTTEMDARLEEFRKRLLSHRLLVTPVDIQFERQRMDMLLEKDEEEPAPTNATPIPSGLPLDPVLERLQRITKSQDQSHHVPSSSNIAPKPQTGKQPHLSSNTRTPQHDCHDLGSSNMNNSSIEVHVLSDPMLNKNNTALSNVEENEGSDCLIDNISVQVIGDAKGRIFHLGQAPEQGNDTATNPAVANDNKSSHSTKFIEVKNQSHKDLLEKEGSKSKRPLRDLPLNQIASRPTDNPQVQKKDKIICEKSRDQQDKDVENHGQVYHKFLKAEKPSSDESIQKVTKGSSKVKHSRNEKDGDTEPASETDSISSVRSYKGKERKANVSRGNTSTGQSNVSKRKPHGKLSSRKQRPEDGACSSDSEAVSELLGAGVEVQSFSSNSSKAKQCVPSRKTVAENNCKETEEDAEFRGNGDQCQSLDKKPSATQKRGENGRGGVKNSNKIQKYTLASASSQAPILSNAEESIQPQSSGQHVQSAIGQTVRDHMFDGSLLLSSVDSWASAFPPSPVPAHRSLPIEKSTKTPSPASKLGNGSPSLQNTPLQSTPLEDVLGKNGDISDEEVHSNEEFESDPLLKLLRQQRSHYIKKLELIEHRLQEFS